MSATARSTAPAAQANLEQRLRDRAELADARVQIGLPADVPTEPNRLYIASIDDLRRTGEPSGLAASFGVTEETYTLSVLVECQRTGRNTRAAVTEKMWEIIAELEQELADDVELADGVDQAYVDAIPTAFTQPAVDGWIAKAVVSIHVAGVIRLG